MPERDDYDKFFLISMDRIDDTQRKLAQAQVAAHAVSWWHQQENVWIVQGGASVSYWRDLLKAFVTGIPGDLFVFNLAENGKRFFASFGPTSHTTWLKSTYAAKVPPKGEITT